MTVLVAEQGGTQQPPDEFVRFLEQNPAYYTIMKSNLCILVVQSLAEKAKSLMMLKAEFPRMEQEDIFELAESLVAVGVVSFFDAGSNRFYYTNEKGKFFLAIYRQAKEKFVGPETGA
ncbi:MAG: hypothetical protein NT067_00230 [Candidatus Diapherotrites archaeon]|nr:hypothetical protein [Candidatus Diapherotrites archaeon]